MRRNIIIISLFSCFLGLFVNSVAAHPVQAPIQIVKIEDRHRFRFVYIEDAQGRCFFLKQATDGGCGLIGEVLGWELGSAVGVSSAPVWIVDPKILF